MLPRFRRHRSVPQPFRSCTSDAGSGTEHRAEHRHVLCPSRGAGVDPSEQFDRVIVVPPKITPMDRLVVRGAVPHEVQLLHTCPNLALASQRIRRAVWERAVECRCPQGRQVTRLEQVPPEPEAQFGDDSPVHFCSFPPSRGTSSRDDQIVLALGVEGNDVEPG